MKAILLYIITDILNTKLWFNTKIRYNSSMFCLFLTFLEYYLQGEERLLKIQYKTVGVRLSLDK